MPLENNGKHIADIVNRTICKTHKVAEGEPCHVIYKGFGNGTGSALCGGRVKRAGYNGTISPMALQLRAPGGRGGRPARS